VTGGSGFIGAALVRRLVDEGRFVRVIDNNSRGAMRRLDGLVEKIEFVEGDVRDPALVAKAAQGVDCVVHLAAVNGTEFFYSQPELVLDVALRGMLAVVDACRAAGVRDLVVASSSEAYQTPPVTPTDENVPLMVPDVRNPRYSYGGGKIVSELIAMNYGRDGFDRMVIFRPHNVYGPDMGWEHVLPQLTLRAFEAAKERPVGPVALTIQGDGSQTRAFVHIDDFTEGLVTVIDKGRHFEIYQPGQDRTSAPQRIGRPSDGGPVTSRSAPPPAPVRRSRGSRTPSAPGGATRPWPRRRRRSSCRARRWR
jgi:dTDP-glucose 4,6-dehydratase/UDP-glucose 4-epimerase